MRRSTTCRSCAAPIMFLSTRKGEAMPVNADTVTGEETLFAPKRGHVAHWATCPAAKDWKGKTRAD